VSGRKPGRATGVYLCAVDKAELLYGARKSRRVADNLAHLERFFQPLARLLS